MQMQGSYQSFFPPLNSVRKHMSIFPKKVKQFLMAALASCLFQHACLHIAYLNVKLTFTMSGKLHFVQLFCEVCLRAIIHTGFEALRGQSYFHLLAVLSLVLSCGKNWDQTIKISELWRNTHCISYLSNGQFKATDINLFFHLFC